jgi:diguanylate cyclase (GGDEF)-like protein
MPRVTQEMPLVSAELGETLLRDQADLRREVLLWQRWVRYLALAALIVLSLIFGGSTIQEEIIPIGALSLVYVAINALTSWQLQRSASGWQVAWFPAFMVVADIVTLAGFCYLTSAPMQAHRVLLLGFLSVQLGVFYLGRRHGALAAGLTILAYLLFALVAPPFIPGPRPTLMNVAFSATLFALITAMLIYTFGSFRERMDALRMYCKVVEAGEVASVPRVGDERWPDDLTLLSRSFDAMRIRLAEQIGTDPLTGCLNRRSLETRLKADLRHARRRGTTVAVAAIDVDRFKEINDTRGHPMGDLILQQIAGIMKSTARDTDSVARFGGDEFVIVLPDTGWQGALTFAERLRRRVDDYTFGTPSIHLALTISIGVALARGTDVSSEKLIQDADVALYKAKEGGRNRVFS